MYVKNNIENFRVAMKLSHLGTIQQETTGFTKKKKRVNTAYPSKNISKTPLERKSENPSFKGVFSMYKLGKTKINLKMAQDAISEAIGSSEKLHLEKLLGDEWISKHIINKDGFVQFKEETPLKLVLSGLKFPFTEMPASIIDWSVTKLQKIKPLKDNSLLKSIINSKLIQKNRTKIQNKANLHELQGLLETTYQYRYDTPELRKISIFNNQAKMYSPKTGNYNSVHERSLNRIVSGYIPAFFLANDAYNLSSLCDNDPKAAKKEKNIRFSQEIKRVTLNAYIQLITLGALQKYIQKSKGWIVGTLTGTVLFTEMFSRLSSGKNIIPISSEQAKEQNEKQRKKLANKAHAADKTPENEHHAKKPEAHAEVQEQVMSILKAPSFKNAAGIPINARRTETFKSFEQSMGLASDAFNIKPAVTPHVDMKDKELKPLLSLNTVLGASLAIITAGYSLRHIGKMKIKNPKPDLKYYADYLKPVKAFYEKIYKGITEKEFTVSLSDFEKLTQKLERNGFKELAESYRNVAYNYSKYKAITDLVEDVKLQNKAKTKLGKLLYEAGYENDIRNILKYNKNKIYVQRFNEFIEKVKPQIGEAKAEDLQKLFYKGDGMTDGFENKEDLLKLYTELTKFVKTNCGEFSRMFDNIFKTNDAKYYEIELNKFYEKLPKTGSDLANTMEKFMTELNSPKEIKLCNKDRYLIKQGVDFVKEPFIFMWNTIKFPYYVTRLIGKFFEPKNLPKYDDGITSLTNCVDKLLPKLNVPDEEFKHEFSKRLKSSFNTLSKSGVSNAELSNLTRFTSKVATIWFLIADNYNMVMLKSNGEDKPTAKLKAKERFVQELSRIFYATMFIDLFNSTFRKAYNNSLLGMSAVTAACTVAGEYTARAAIGMPVTEQSQAEILEKERAHYEDTGIKGKFYRFMSRLTGKKVLTQRDNK